MLQELRMGKKNRTIMSPAHFTLMSITKAPLPQFSVMYLEIYRLEICKKAAVLTCCFPYE